MSSCDIIRASEAQPGDLIFFQGTYDTAGASHVGIYVGNGMMIHCGNPISYASIETNYCSLTFIVTAESADSAGKGEIMGVKLEKIGADLEKARKKRAEWDAKVKDLERRYREEENTEIHEMVHAANLTPEQLAELIRKSAVFMPQVMDKETKEDGQYGE